MDFGLLFYINTLSRFPNFKIFFLSKSSFHRSVVASLMKLTYLENTMSDLKMFCTKAELKEQPFWKQQKVSFELVTQLVISMC